jgi:hypothetical protein
VARDQGAGGEEDDAALGGASMSGAKGALADGMGGIRTFSHDIASPRSHARLA